MTDFKRDTGYAWVVCGASFWYQVMRGGLVYTAGVLFIMFQDALDASDSALALITSLHYSISFLVGPFVGLLVERFGERQVAILGSMLATGGLALSSLSSQVIHLYICYSILNGIGIGFSYNPALTILSKYFHRRKRLATGISACGSGIGSLVFPQLIRLLEHSYGWRGTLLLLAGLNAQTIFLAALFRPPEERPVKQSVHDTERNDSKMIKNMNEKEGSTRCFQEYRPLFFNINFICLCMHSMLSVFSSTLVYTHLGNYTLSLNFSRSDVTTIYTVMGGVVALSRLVFGIIPDLTNMSSYTLPCVAALVNGVVTCLFPFMTPLYVIYTYGVLFAVLISPYNTLCAPMTNDSVSDRLMPTAYGIVCMFCVPGVVFGAPLAAYIYERSMVYAHSFYLAGALFLFSGILLLPTLTLFKHIIQKGQHRQKEMEYFDKVPTST